MLFIFYTYYYFITFYTLLLLTIKHIFEKAYLPAYYCLIIIHIK
jgi:hypothetical protein